MGWVVSPGNPGSDLRGGHTDTAGARDLEMPRPERRDEERERGGGAWCKSWYSPARADDYTNVASDAMQAIVFIGLMVKCILQ